MTLGAMCCGHIVGLVAMLLLSLGQSQTRSSFGRQGAVIGTFSCSILLGLILDAPSLISGGGSGLLFWFWLKCLEAPWANTMFKVFITVGLVAVIRQNPDLILETLAHPESLGQFGLGAFVTGTPWSGGWCDQQRRSQSLFGLATHLPGDPGFNLTFAHFNSRPKLPWWSPAGTFLTAFAMPANFQAAQDRWAESLLTEVDYCDAVAILGEDEVRVPFVRALVATLSPPLRAALYGKFQESSKKEISLKDVTPDAFDVMLRSACHLDPKLNPESAVSSLFAARLYLIEALEQHCLEYLQTMTDCSLVLRAMTAALKLPYVLPTEVQHKQWTLLILKSRDAIESNVFVETHGCIISQLIKLDVLDINEERLWSRLVDWSANAVRTPELLGPFADAMTSPIEKRAKTDVSEPKPNNPNDLSSTEKIHQQAILCMAAKHIRFAVMRKNFFLDSARAFLGREDSEKVMMYFLGRPSAQLVTTKRSGLQPTEQVFPVEVMQKSPDSEAENITALVMGNGVWMPTAGCHLKIAFPQKFCLTKVELTFGREGSMWTCKFRRAKTDEHEIKMHQDISGGRVRILRPSNFSGNVTGLSEICLCPDFPLAGPLLPPAANLTSVKVIGKNTLEQYASDIVNSLSTELFVASN
eukprot:symbB.v1.2.023383.t2/scaffold2106.1/size89218/2